MQIAFLKDGLDNKDAPFGVDLLLPKVRSPPQIRRQAHSQKDRSHRPDPEDMHAGRHRRGQGQGHGQGTQPHVAPRNSTDKSPPNNDNNIISALTHLLLSTFNCNCLVSSGKSSLFVSFYPI